MVGNYNGGDSSQTQNCDEPEDGTRKKKVRSSVLALEAMTNDLKFKKVHGAEQYVCRKCGRTDSPEWRKVLGRGVSIVSGGADPSPIGSRWP